MTPTELRSSRNGISDTAEAIEFYYAKGWTDGLPVVPPTEESIRAMLDAAGLEPNEEITFLEYRRVSVKAEKVAINAVMAGCVPEYMPVIVATLKAIGDPRWGYEGPSTSTGGSAVLMIINGPIRQELGLNCGENLFGPGFRANATIGRAVRLVMRNVMGTLPGYLDRATLGHGGKFTYCIAENEEESPWVPLHVERGFRPEQSTVTVLAALAPHQFANHLSHTAEGILTTGCAHIRISAGVARQLQYALIIAGEHMRVIVRDGWSKHDIKRFCFEKTRTSQGELKRIAVLPGEITQDDETILRPLVPSPEDFIVVAAGGPVGGFSAFIPGWSGKGTSESLTREILRP
ncbi:MAG: hypothetical protein A2156_01385 [Deltaproteobacteria bacterium RBG_16_48_10]|nr:MAG: hypothetical protein A2156_01385 [Deltaproteobacteria bacterium RBG_16_48_10]